MVSLQMRMMYVSAVWNPNLIFNCRNFDSPFGLLLSSICSNLYKLAVHILVNSNQPNLC